MQTFELAFENYNPITDERLEPPTRSHFSQYPEVPLGLDETIKNAKKLLPTESLDEIKAKLPALPELLEEGLILIMHHWDELADKDYHPADEAECLRVMQLYGKAAISKEEWPAYMATLALALVGTIYNTLWPTDKVQDAEEDKLNKTHNRYEKITQLAYTASKAVSYGQALEVELKERRARKKGGKSAHEKKHKIAKIFCDWVFNEMPGKFLDGYTSAAAIEFRENVLQGEEKQIATTGNFDKFLKKRLEAYCNETGREFPFKRKNQLKR